MTSMLHCSPFGVTIVSCSLKRKQDQVCLDDKLVFSTKKNSVYVSTYNKHCSGSFALVAVSPKVLLLVSIGAHSSLVRTDVINTWHN